MKKAFVVPVWGWGWSPPEVPEPFELEVLRHKNLDDIGRVIFGRVVRSSHSLSGYYVVLTKRNENPESKTYSVSADPNKEVLENVEFDKPLPPHEMSGYATVSLN